jgi:predicted GIY-YIG superfamily endonuclease
MYYVYCLESQKNSTLYIGYTTDLKKRFADHNDGKRGDFCSGCGEGLQVRLRNKIKEV